MTAKKELLWMLLSEEFTEEDGALMPGAPGTARFGLGA